MMPGEPSVPFWHRRVTRKQALRYGLAGAGALCGGGIAARCLKGVFRPGAATPPERIALGDAYWNLWRKRGWAREARHYAQLEDRTVKCLLCPNYCVLEPGERGRCHNRVNWNGRLHTLVYGNPCAFHVDPIEKKPLMHFLPATGVFSIATSGCCLNCLNCQNWDISQKAPEETKDPHGEEIRATPARLASLTFEEVARLSMFPEDVVALAERFRCPSIAYTYAEPIVFYEYMQDTARLARARKIRNVWITCGHINRQALEDLCPCLDAANVNLKSFSEEIYHDLNSGRLHPVLDALKTLKDRGVWFEVTNLIVPTYTDQPDMIRRMCDWLAANLGPDYPLHFSRFHPAYKLTHLPPTPADILMEARAIARRAGLRYVYIGNIRDIPDAENTFCPNCKRVVVERDLYAIRAFNLKNGRCRFCGQAIAGVWA